MTIVLTEGQQKALEATVYDTRPVMILGGPGTGKSTLQAYIKGGWGHETVFCATTGVANQQLFDNQGGDGTASSVLSLPTRMYNKADLSKLGRKTRDLLMKSDAINRITIDEAGMLGADPFDLMGERIQKFNKAGATRKARNIQLILVADLLQIPPVMSEMEERMSIDRYGTKHFFMSQRFKDMDFNIISLDEVKRTEDEEFIYHLNVIRYGDEARLDDTLKYFNQRAGHKIPENLPVISPYNKVVSRINEVSLNANPNPCGVYTPDIKGDYDMKNCPVEETLRLKEGCPVMTLVNAPDGEYNNGSLGVVVQMEEGGVHVTFNDSGETHLVKPYTYAQNESYISGKETMEDGSVRDILRQRTVGEASCIPLKLAAASTCHKVQGKTITGQAVIDMGWGFNRPNFGTALTYVALSRFKRVEDIFLKVPLTKAHIKVCQTTVDWLRDQGCT